MKKKSAQDIARLVNEVVGDHILFELKERGECDPNEIAIAISGRVQHRLKKMSDATLGQLTAQLPAVQIIPDASESGRQYLERAAFQVFISEVRKIVRANQSPGRLVAIAAT